ncbi:YciI family protein [Streptosporangium saharense]|uniref:YCII-related domain-containing protein n=1 Tax=Streptosporangium saharense TaxID=1706840 RepID=A0A7W7QSG0_9ACTN|nr:YciI family protein [Streptosporangium saharense]MBB4918864.1 hypothetical protein [Streptosporangium saharense]
MKYLLAIYENPGVWDGVPERVRDEARHRFVEAISASGEVLGRVVLGDFSHGAVVQVRDGLVWITGCPLAGREEHLVGCYVVECESRERAHAIAAMIAGAGGGGLGVEVRPIVSSAGAGV